MANGIVIYSDGGANPNPGPAGWGIHGYLYDEATPTKGAGNPEHLLTKKGYVLKADVKSGKAQVAEVTPLHYFDGYGSIGAKLSNNVAELQAATWAFTHAANYDISEITIITDSEYTCKGLNDWVPRWIANNWIKPSGEPVANTKWWLELIAAREVLLNRGITVNVQWIKGHNDHLGNECADQWASFGVIHAQRGNSINNITTSLAQGYWTYEVEKHPFINHRRIYFNSLKELCRDGEYFIGEHGTDDELAGKRIADGAIAVLRLAKPDPVIETLRNHVCAAANGDESLIFGRLDKLFSKKAHKLIMEMGTDVILRVKPHRLDFEFFDEDPVCREQRPPRIAHRVVDEAIHLADMLDKYLHPGEGVQDSVLCLTDLTPILYETTVKAEKNGTTKNVTKLKPEFNVGYAALEVPALYRDGVNTNTANVKLMLGIDLLDRNALKRLEDMQPKVTLLTWPEGDGVFRYATVVETNDNSVGIWAGVYSNVRVVP